MSIRFYCQNCRQLLKAKDDKVGRRMPCPKCKEPVTVPAEDDLDAVRDGDQLSSESELDPFAALAVYDDEIVYDTEYESHDDEEGETAEGGFDRRMVAVPRRTLYGHAVLLVALTVAGVAAGYLIGQNTQPVAPPPEVIPQRVVVDGRVRWEAATGLLADKGAVVIALPENLEPSQKLAGENLGPSSPALAKDDEMVRTIEDWGGDYARTNEVGEFELFLLPGKYQVLIVSRQANRPGNQPPNRDHLGALGQFFTAPQELLGAARYRWEMDELGEESQLLHDFELEGN